MALRDTAANAHDEAEVLLPWYAVGELQGDERAQVERHIGSCVACQRQLREEQRLIEGFQMLQPEVDSGWARLRSRIEQENRSISPIRRTFAGVRALAKRPAIATLAAAQLAFVVIAGTILATLPAPGYHTLSNPRPASAAAAANVIVVFRGDATEAEVTAALRANGASLVGGPTAAGAYLLHVPNAGRAAVLTRLQAGGHVEMAQPIDGVAQ